MFVKCQKLRGKFIREQMAKLVKIHNAHQLFIVCTYRRIQLFSRLTRLPNLTTHLELSHPLFPHPFHPLRPFNTLYP